MGRRSRTVLVADTDLTRLALAPAQLLIRGAVKATTIGSGPVVAFCLVSGFAYLTTLTESFGLSPTMFVRSSLETGFYGFECGALGVIQFIRGNIHLYAAIAVVALLVGLGIGGALAFGVAHGSRIAGLFADRIERWHDPVQGVTLAVFVLLLLLMAMLSGPIAGHKWSGRQAAYLRSMAVAGRCPIYETIAERFHGCVIIADAERTALATK